MKFWHLATVIICFSISLIAEETTSDSLQQALSRAKLFLSDKRIILDVGSLFLKQKISPDLFDKNDIPTDDAFAKIFGLRYTVKGMSLLRTIESDRILKNIPKLRPLNNYFYLVPTNYRHKIIDPWDDILLKALYCDITGFDALDDAILSTLRDGQGGYYDTHQLLALLMLDENSCLSKEEIGRRKNLIVEAIVVSLNKDDVFSDLYAERVACLYWAGAGVRVKPEWIQLIKSAQRADGGWADIGLTRSSAHPTSLAAIAIKYFLSPNNEEIYFYRR